MPSVLNRQKLQTDVTKRNEEQAIEQHFEMPSLNRLPTALGTLYTYEGVPGFFFVVALLAALLAAADRWLKRSSPARLLFGVGLVECVVGYEGSLAVYTVTLRAVVLLMILVEGANGWRLRPRSDSTRQRP